LELARVIGDGLRHEPRRLVQTGPERAARFELEDALAGLRRVRLPRRADDDALTARGGRDREGPVVLFPRVAPRVAHDLLVAGVELLAELADRVLGLLPRGEGRDERDLPRGLAL